MPPLVLLCLTYQNGLMRKTKKVNEIISSDNTTRNKNVSDKNMGRHAFDVRTQIRSCIDNVPNTLHLFSEFYLRSASNKYKMVDLTSDTN